MEECQKASSPTMKHSSSDPICAVHRNKSLVYFCLPCNKMICETCTVDEHRFHGEMKKATEVLEQHVMKLKGAIPNIEKVISNGESMLNCLKKESSELQMALSNATTEMRVFFNDVHEILNDEENKIVIKMKTEAEKKRKLLSKCVDTTTEAVEQVEESKLVLEDAVNGTTKNASLLQEEKQLRFEIDEGIKHLNKAVSKSKLIQNEFTDINQFVPNNSLGFLCRDLQYNTKSHFINNRHSSRTFKTKYTIVFDSLPRKRAATDLDDIHTLHRSSRVFSRCRSSETIMPVSVIEAKCLIGPTNENTAYPNSVCCSTEGTLFVTDSRHNLFRIITYTGECLMTVGPTRGKEYQFYEPTGIALDHDGNILVLDGKGTGQVQKFSVAGKFLSKFDVRKEAYMDEPIGVVVLGNGDVLVTDGGKHCVHTFKASGKYRGKFGNPTQLNSPAGIAANETRVVIADKGNHCIFIFDHCGKLISQIGEDGTLPEKFNIPYGVAIYKDGHILVSESGNHRISVLTIYGVFVRHFGGKGSENGKFLTPKNLFIDHRGLLVVCDEENQRLQFFKLDQ